jgi:hypothetical protein
MPLTPAQLQTLKTNILATPEANALYQNGDLDALAAFYNAPASPVFWAWRTRVTKSELVTSVGPDGTTFNWTGNGFITRAVGELTAWQELFNGVQSVNPSLANVRQAFSDIFSGTGNAAANRTHLLGVARRLTTRLERLFATGTGSTASPGVLVVEGTLTTDELIGL